MKAIPRFMAVCALGIGAALAFQHSGSFDRLRGLAANAYPAMDRSNSRAAGVVSTAVGIPPKYSLTWSWWYRMETFTAGVGDVSGDGRDDVVAVGSDFLDGPYNAYIFVQLPSGELADPIVYPLPGEPIDRAQHGLRLADLNEDGRDDIVMTPVHTEGIRFLLSVPGGGFEWGEDRWINQRATANAVVADVDGDGHIDVISHHALDLYQFLQPQPRLGMLITYFGNGKGEFDRHAEVQTGEDAMASMVIGDLGSDELPDLLSASTSYSGQFDSRLRERRHDGNAGFLLPSIAYSGPYSIVQSLAQGDMDGDGKTDLSAVTPFGANKLLTFLQGVDGQLASSPIVRRTQGNPTNLEQTDLNGDGRADLMHLSQGTSQFFYYLQSDSGLEYPVMVELLGQTESPGIGNNALATGDVNGDGVTDVVASLGRYGLSILHGKLTPYAGTGTLPDAPAIGTAVLDPATATETAEFRRFEMSVTAPTSDGGAPITGYTVYSVPEGGWDNNAGTLAAVHVMLGLDDNKSYTFYARAHNAAGTGPASSLSNSVTLGTPTDPNQPPVLSLRAINTGEGNLAYFQYSAVFYAELNKPAPKGGVSFDFISIDGTAQAGSDYESVALNNRIIPEGQTTATIVVEAIGDTVVEPDETFQGQISDVQGAVLGADKVTAKIINDDTPGPRIIVEGEPVIEGEKLVYFDVRLTEAVANDVTFDIFTQATGATPGVDYDEVNLQQRVIPAGSLKYTLAVQIRNDSLFEVNEGFLVRISNINDHGSNIGVAGDLLPVNIFNDDPEPTLSLSDLTVEEGSKGIRKVTLKASLSAVMPHEVSFSAITLEGTAKHGSDLIPRYLAGFKIPAGDLVANVEVQVVGDVTVEPAETFSVRLENPHRVSILDSTAQVTLLNDDIPNGISVSNRIMAEGSIERFEPFTILLSEPSSQPVLFDVYTSPGTAAAGQDYHALVLTDQVIPAGSTSAIINVLVEGDQLVESDETFTVNLVNVRGATISDAQGLGKLINDDVPTLSVDDLSIVEGDSGWNVANFVVKLSDPVAFPVSFHFRTLDGSAQVISDYYPALGGRTIDPGRTSVRVIFSVFGDSGNEPDETLKLEIANAIGATIGKNFGTATILNDDPPSLGVMRAVTIAPAPGCLVKAKSKYLVDALEDYLPSNPRPSACKANRR